MGDWMVVMYILRSFVEKADRGDGGDGSGDNVLRDFDL